MNTFKCHDCKQTKEVKHSGGTGYAKDKAGNYICYACCAVRDKADMIASGKACLYLHDGELINWPGTLRFRVYNLRKGRHNMARVRYDFSFRGPDGKTWSGYQIGDNTQIAHCRRLKR